MSRQSLHPEARLGKAKSRFVLMHALRRKMLQEVDDILPMSFDPAYPPLRRRAFFRPFADDVDASFDDLRRTARWHLSPAARDTLDPQPPVSARCDSDKAERATAHRTVTRTVFWGGSQAQVMSRTETSHFAKRTNEGQTASADSSDGWTGTTLSFTSSRIAKDDADDFGSKTLDKPPVGVPKPTEDEPRYRSAVTLNCAAPSLSREHSQVTGKHILVENARASPKAIFRNGTIVYPHAGGAGTAISADVNNNVSGDNSANNFSTETDQSRLRNVIPIRIHRVIPQPGQTGGTPLGRVASGQPLVVHVVLPERSAGGSARSGDVTPAEVSESSLMHDKATRLKSFVTSSHVKNDQLVSTQSPAPQRTNNENCEQVTASTASITSARAISNDRDDQKKRTARSCILRSLRNASQPLSNSASLRRGASDVKRDQGQLVAGEQDEDSAAVKSLLRHEGAIASHVDSSGTPTSHKSFDISSRISRAESSKTYLDKSSSCSDQTMSSYSLSCESMPSDEPGLRPDATKPHVESNSHPDDQKFNSGASETSGYAAVATTRDEIVGNHENVSPEPQTSLEMSEKRDRAEAPASNLRYTARASTITQSTEAAAVIPCSEREVATVARSSAMASTEVDVISSNRGNMLADEMSVFQFRLPGDDGGSGEFHRHYGVLSADESEFDDRVTDFFGGPGYDLDSTGCAVGDLKGSSVIYDESRATAGRLDEDFVAENPQLPPVSQSDLAQPQTQLSACTETSCPSTNSGDESVSFDPGVILTAEYTQTTANEKPNECDLDLISKQADKLQASTNLQADDAVKDILPVTPGSNRSSPAREKSNEKSNTSAKIPRFYFPSGRPRVTDELKSTLDKMSEAFAQLGKERLAREELRPITMACGYTEYWKAAFFKASVKRDTDTVSKSDLISMWNKVVRSNHDDASRFVRMLAKPGNNFLEFDDLLCLMQDIVETHPGLIFLREAPEFHTRYMNTVIARIFYLVNRSWSGQITVPELRKSNFLAVLGSLEEEDDINMITDFFSYEHFYVVYCKFWELDTDHDLVIDKFDLARHANGALSSRLIDRVLCGAVTRWDMSDHRAAKMSYVDFVWFLISEEDKKSHTSVEYWFRCMDMDGDGVISMYEMEYFYEEQMRKLEQLDIEPLPFEDCVCQMLDMVMPSNRNQITLKDLKNCKMAHVFFDTFFNVEKYLDHEQKDPFAPPKDIDNPLSEPSDWDKFAAEEYEILVAEEQANEQDSFDTHYNEDIDPLIEEEMRNLAVSSGMVLSPHEGQIGAQHEMEVKADAFRQTSILTDIDPPDAGSHRRLLT